MGVLEEYDMNDDGHNYTFSIPRVPWHEYDLTEEEVFKKTSHGRWKGLSLADRFLMKTERGEDDECWNWIGSKNGQERGLIQFKKSSISAPRVCWVMNFGSIPKGLFVCHTCDNPSCINPQHLFLGTNADNIQDMYDKGRREAHKGEKCATSILTGNQVMEIRKLYVPRTNKRRFELAKMFGVSEGTIQDIVYHKSWRHIK